MKGRTEYITKDELVPGEAYEVDARSFKVAIWDGEQFHGLRRKFSLTFMDTEFHWDNGPPHGTVKPIRKLG